MKMGRISWTVRALGCGLMGAWALGGCGASPRAVPRAARSVEASARPALGSGPLTASPARTREACDDPKRGRECLLGAFKVRYDEPTRDAALERACTAGYAPACYFREPAHTPEEEAIYVRRACSFSMSDACSKLAHQLWAHELDPAVQTPVFGYRWVKRATRLTPLRTSVELIAHPGARLILLDVDGGTAFALYAGNLLARFERGLAVSSVTSTG